MANSGAEPSVGGTCGGADVRQDRALRSARLVRRAGRAGEALRRALQNQDDTRAELRTVVGELDALHARLAEWTTAHHLIHGVLSDGGPFEAAATSVGDGRLDALQRQALLRHWRPCQQALDRLIDFAEGIVHIGRPFEWRESGMAGDRWVVDLVALQRSLEDALADERTNGGGLIELAAALRDACLRGLTVADERLQALVDELRRASVALWGGMA